MICPVYLLFIVAKQLRFPIVNESSMVRVPCKLDQSRFCILSKNKTKTNTYLEHCYSSCCSISGFQLPVVPTCLSALGLQSGAISDSKMTASSYYSSRHQPANGRLHFQKSSRGYGAWSVKSNQGDQWLQVDLGKVTKVRMVGLQGRADSNQWVKTFSMSFSNDGMFWHNTDVSNYNNIT